MLLLLDHANIDHSQIRAENLLSPWLAYLKSASLLPHTLHIKVRIYGGWYEGSSVSKSRYDAISYYGDNWPAIARIDDFPPVRISFEFSDNLLLDPMYPMTRSSKITHTVAIRKTPPEFGVTDLYTQCEEPTCEKQNIKRWLKKNIGCLSKSCPHSFGDCFQRRQQKQVDMHLATDMIEACLYTEYRHIAIASDDTDFIPPVLWALSRKSKKLSSLSLLRSTTVPALYCHSNIIDLGGTIINYQRQI